MKEDQIRSALLAGPFALNQESPQISPVLLSWPCNPLPESQQEFETVLTLAGN